MDGAMIDKPTAFADQDRWRRDKRNYANVPLTCLWNLWNSLMIVKSVITGCTRELICLSQCRWVCDYKQKRFLVIKAIVLLSRKLARGNWGILVIVLA